AENGCATPEFGGAGTNAYPSFETSRSSDPSRTRIDDCRLPSDVNSERPSRAMAMPSSSPGANVICSGAPSGNRCRQMCKRPLPFDEKYIHRPSGDHAADVHCPSGPTRRVTRPSIDTSRHGCQTGRTISATSTQAPSGDGYERWAMPCGDPGL